MISDIRTMIWKESKSLLRYQGRRSQLVISLLTPLIVSIYFPTQLGMDWANGYFSLFVGIVIPLMVVGITVPDAIAGERERHTLETLLASRLPDRAILLGKILVSVLVGWCVTLLVFALSLIVLNVTHPEEGIIFYRSGVFLAQLASSLGMSLLVAGLGVLISMRAPTVQIAQQNLFTFLMVPMMLLGFIPLIITQLGSEPGSLDNLRTFISQIRADQVVWSVIGFIYLVDAGFLLVGLTRFNRHRLV